MHRLGGWRANVAYGQRVEVRTANGSVYGVVARKRKDDEKVEWDQLYVDIGAADVAEARDLVAPGDPIVAVGPPLELAHDRIASRSLDNRAGVYVALETLLRLAAEEVAADVAVVATAQEELGHRGSRRPRTRCVPISPSRSTSPMRPTFPQETRTRQAITASDRPALFRGPAISPRVFELLVAAAEGDGIAHTVETGMRSYTDADDTFTSGAGVPTGLVSIPLRYMHSATEIVQLWTSRTASASSLASRAGSSPAPTSVARLAR